MSNARAERLLRKAGIPFEPEPRWIKEGQKPDFYCSGKKPFWCEVKTLERPEDTDKFHEAFHDLVGRTNNLDGKEQGIAYIHDDYSDRDAKKVVHLLKRGLKRFENGDAPDTRARHVKSGPEGVCPLLRCDQNPRPG
ncbi:MULTISPECIES: hypothetical protein [unclassified Bradyrhizobium]|uniref:hypothetical protein n=1 Tax=unclassified Bradyrhizobium TaxID=2631580 RepID=UPI00339A8BC7